MPHPGRIVESLRNAALGLVEAVQTRLELLANELEDQGARLVRIAVLYVAAGFCTGVAVVLAAVFTVVLFWDSNRLLVLGLMTAFFAVAAGVVMAVAASLRAQRPRPFAETLAELERDRQAIEAARKDA